MLLRTAFTLLGSASRLLPEVAAELGVPHAEATLHEVRIGLRPASPDGLPMLGRAPGAERLYVATGHGASGLQLGPYSGAAVAGLVVGEHVECDLGPFNPDRFGAR